MDFWSIAGFFVSLIGIGITIFQIYRIKSITKATQQEVKKRMDDIQQFFTYAEIEKSETFSALILSYIEGEEYEAAALKIEEIKKILFSIKNNSNLRDLDDVEIRKCIQNLSIDIKSIRERNMLGTEFDIKIIMSNLEKIGGILLDVSTTIKNKSYDRK